MITQEKITIDQNNFTWDQLQNTWESQYIIVSDEVIDVTKVDIKTLIPYFTSITNPPSFSSAKGLRKIVVKNKITGVNDTLLIPYY